jgi:hypothetical protein
MAIYKNREVSVVGPNPQANTPETINVQYKDGSHENVPTHQVKYTAEEKKLLVKNHPSKYDTVDTIEDADIQAVRVGVAPPSDPTVKEQARAKAQHDKQVELGNKQRDEVTKQQKAELDKEVNAPVSPLCPSNVPERTTPTHRTQTRFSNFKD